MKKEKNQPKPQKEAWCPKCQKNVVLNESAGCPHCGTQNLKQILRG